MTLNDIRSCIHEIIGGETGPIAGIKALLEKQERALERIESGGHMDRVSSNQLVNFQSITSNIIGEPHQWPDDNRMHKVPYGFLFPSFSVGTMWNLWFYGNENAKICPYKYISPSVDLVSDHCKSNFSRCKRVMARLVKIAIDGEKIVKQRNINASNGQEVYEYSYPILLDQLYSRCPNRVSAININTIGNRLSKLHNALT